MVIDEQDRIWIGRHPMGESVRDWWVVGVDAVEAVVTLPATASVLAARRDHVTILLSDEQGAK